MPEVILHCSKNQDLEKRTIQEIEELCWRKGFQLIKIPKRASLRTEQPFLTIEAYKLGFPFSISELERILDHVTQNQLKVDSLERFTTRKTSWFYKNYVWLISFFFLIFIGLPFLAPVLMHYGKEKEASYIYKVYSVLCHQLAFRSYFLFGEQFQYPRQLARVPGFISYEQVTGKDAENLDFARKFVGSSDLGYKVAICERDIAIYGSMAIFGLLFQISKRKIKAIPWYFWVIAGLIPIAIDGGSQLPGLASGWPVWLPQRESTFILRTITGTMFGVFTAWFLFPQIEETFTVSNILRK